MKRKYGGSYGGGKRFKTVPGAYNMLATLGAYGASKAYNYFKGSGARSTAPKSRATGVITTGQYDFRTQYRKKRRSRFKRKIWKKFTRKVQAVTGKLVGTNTVVFNDKIDGVSNNTNPQGYVVANLYGIAGTDSANEVGCTDVSDIFGADPRLNAPTRKALFGSGVLDLTMRNTSSPEVPIEVDIYELTFRSETSSANFTAMQIKGETNTPVIGATTGLTLTTRGTTLFDFPCTIKYGRLQIVKKTKLFLPVGNTATYQLRDPKNHMFTGNDYDDTTGFIRPGVTKSVLIVFKPVVNAGTQVNTSGLSIGVTRKFMYKIFEDSTDADGLL